MDRTISDFNEKSDGMVPDILPKDRTDGPTSPSGSTASDTDLENDNLSPTVYSSTPAPVNDTTAPASQLQGSRLIAVEVCLLFGLFLSSMESSIVATALVTIAEKFDDYIRVQWVVLAYLLCYMAFSVLITRSSDVFGRKWTVITCLLIFLIGSLACGLAKSMLQLIGFRALQGIGGSGLFAMAMVCLPELTPLKYFPMMSGGIGITFALSSALGPLLGGAITHADWRWIFLLNVPAAAVLIAVILFSWRTAESTPKRKISFTEIDFFGATLLVAASVLTIFALQEGGATVYAWNSPVIIATLTVGGCCWVALALWIYFCGTRAGGKSRIQCILPATIFVNRTICMVLISTLLTGYVFLSVLIELPQRFQIVNQESAVLAGVHLLPLVTASALGSLLGGLLNSKNNYTFYCLNVACALVLIGAGLMSSIPHGTVISQAQYGYQFILGLGLGLNFATATVMTAMNTSPADKAAAQGAVSQARIFGGSIGLSVATIILNQDLGADLSGILSTTQLANLRQSLSTIAQLQPMQQGAVVEVFAKSFNSQLRICTYIAAAGVLASLATWDKGAARQWDQNAVVEGSEESTKEKEMEQAKELGV